MTKSVAIVNTSNWDGEDIWVNAGQGTRIKLRPGEHTIINGHPGDYKDEIKASLFQPVSVLIQDAQVNVARPFRLGVDDESSSEQLIPELNVTFESSDRKYGK